MAVTVKTGTMEPFGACVIISNGDAELVVTTDMGPRVISYKAFGGKNLFYADLDRVAFTEDERILKAYGKNRYYFMGGHRLWETPELIPETYYPDDEPVTWVETGNGGVFTAPVRPYGLQYSLEVSMAEKGTKVEVVGRILNAGDSPCEHAPWGITQMAPGGVAVAPQNTLQCAPLPNRLVSYWPYDDMNDDRFYAGEKYFTLKQDTECTGPFKFGTKNDLGWCGYVVYGQLFRKTFGTPGDSYSYPDYGCNFESYTDNRCLEVESLGKIVNIQPGQCAELRETWDILPLPAGADLPDAKSAEFAALIDSLVK